MSKNSHNIDEIERAFALSRAGALNTQWRNNRPLTRSPMQGRVPVSQTAALFFVRNSYIFLFRSNSKSRPNNIRGGKCPSVRPSVRPQKVYSISMKFGKQVEVDE